MTAVFTPSLFDAAPDGSWGPGALPAGPAAVSWTGAHRTRLDERSWVDVVPGWMPGADLWFDELVGEGAWTQRPRRMFTQEIVEPRLTCGWALADAPSPSEHLAAALLERYREPFDRVSANFYRDGADSVAWHGDRVRFVHPQPVVAIVSFGPPRRFGLQRAAGAH